VYVLIGLHLFINQKEFLLNMAGNLFGPVCRRMCFEYAIHRALLFMKLGFQKFKYVVD
jgi:hypothetical protein